LHADSVLARSSSSRYDGEPHGWLNANYS